MRKSIILFTLCLVLAACNQSASVHNSAGVSRKDVSEFAGQRCNTPPRGSGVIVGQFSGVDESPFIGSGDALVSVDRYRCFSSMEECRGWLYTMQSLYTNAGTPSLVRCTKR